MTKTAWLITLLVLAGQTLSVAGAERRGRAGRAPLEAKVVPGDLGSEQLLQYDTGLNAGFPLDTGMTVVGNRVQSWHQYLLNHAHVTRVTLFPQNGGVQSFSFWYPASTMNTAMLIPGGIVQANLMAGQFNQVTLATPLHVFSEFQVTFIGFYGGFPAGLIGLDDMSNLMQGFHAIQAVYSAPNLINIQAIPGRNAMLRLSGKFFLPVELMKFEIQD